MTTKSSAKIEAEKALADTPHEQADNPNNPVEQLDPYLPADYGKGTGPVSAPVPPVPATVLDIPANEPYPDGDPKQPTNYLEINGLVPPEPTPPAVPTK